MVEEKKDETQWNIGKIHSYHIGELIREASRLQRELNYPKWFIALRTIREMMNQDLKEPERLELDEVEKKATRLEPKWKTWNSNLNYGLEVTPKLREEAQEFEIIVRTYQRRLMDLLKKQGFFPNKQDKRFLSR